MRVLGRRMVLPWGHPLTPGHTAVKVAPGRHVATSPARGTAVPMAFTKHTKPGQKDSSSRQPPLIIMHGLMGSKMNWKSMAKAIATKTGREVYTVDARNHGDSPHTEAHSYPLLAADLLFFMQQHSIPTAALMGHSMGGRAVMAAALTEPSVVEKLFVLDISPVGTSLSVSTLPRFLEIMRRVTLPPNLTPQQAKKHVDDLLRPAITEASIRQFLLTNLTQAPQGDGYMWRVNVEGIARNFNPHISTFPSASLPLRSFDGETAFIAGALSDYVRPEDEDEIQTFFPQASFHYLEGAGHWLHADRPQAFLELLTPLLLP